uniref:Transmembrane protein 144 n=1 Tax=Macrostomum lignano TaxID=282301 RepID=A0A1I8I332_9PLAT
MSILVAETLQLNSDVDNSTQPPDWAGFTATGIAVLFYGSNYVPVKKFDTGDGMLFQFFLCLGIWLVGMAVNAIRAFPLFHPTVLLGGAIWTFGNLFAVPIIQTIGMGLGILIWGMFNMLTGWATGRFGVLGIPPQVPNSLAFNYAGVAISAVASVLFFFEGSISVYDDVFANQEQGSSTGLYPSLSAGRRRGDKAPIVSQTAPVPAAPQQLQKQPFWLQMSPLRRRIFGVTLSVLIGPMFGVGFVPTYYVQAHVPGASKNGLDYVFAHFTGIFCASSVFLILYTVVTGNRPSGSPRIILPAIVSGMMWGVAGASWFLANQVLSESISYPIISSAPAIVAALWSVCVFREIRGARNLVILCIAICMCTAGSIMNGLSKT